MMRVLLLRLDAPLMSFGGVCVDSRGPTTAHPGRSLITGLLGNALGIDHAEAGRLNRLQERLRVASRADAPGQVIVDYQTADLGQEFLKEDGWTTWDAPQGRKGGEAAEGTHIRLRSYHASRIQTVALTLEPNAEAPSLDQLATALDHPARPLFIGRKPCLPAGRLLIGLVESPSLLDALRQAPPWRHRHGQGRQTALDAWWPEAPATPGPHTSTVEAVVDERDWREQYVTGRRLVRHGRLDLPPAAGVNCHG
jgi:CRISPR system Cascade subunit CasD